MLVRRLFGKNQGVLAALILATMPGFVNITHWLLVDNALLFHSRGNVAFRRSIYG